MEVGVWVDLRGGGRRGRVCVARAAVRRQPGGRRGGAGDVRRVLLGPRYDAKPACARKHTRARECGAGGRNGGGGVPSSRGKLAAAEGSNGGARVGRGGAREGRGYGRAFFHAQNRPSEQHGACQKQGGEGGEVGEAAGNACAGGGCAWASAGRDAGRARGGGGSPDTEAATPPRGASRRREPSKRRSRRRPTAGIRTLTPADLRPTGAHHASRCSRRQMSRKQDLERNKSGRKEKGPDCATCAQQSGVRRREHRWPQAASSGLAGPGLVNLLTRRRRPAPRAGVLPAPGGHLL